MKRWGNVLLAFMDGSNNSLDSSPCIFDQECYEDYYCYGFMIDGSRFSLFLFSR